jgi:capsular exopolysaccharide synthesis family protein
VKSFSLEEDCSLKRYLPSIKQYSWILLVCVLLSAVAGYFIGKSQPTVYQVTSSILIQVGSPGTSITTLTSNTDPTQSLAAANTYAAEITTREVMTFVYKQYPEIGAHHFSANDLLFDITAVPSTTSATVAITANATVPDNAILLANRVADGFVLYSQQLAQHQLETLRQGLQTQLTSYQQQQLKLQGILSKISNPNDPNYIFTNNSLSSVNKTIDTLNGQLLGLPSTVRSDVSVTQHAELVDVVSSGKTTIIVAATAGVGLLLGILIMMLLIFLDDRLRGDDQVQKKLGIAYLGSVTTNRELGSNPTRLSGTALDEISDVYAGLRLTGLKSRQWLAPQGGVLLVTSAQEAEGKTTIAAALAASIAEAGGTVVVVDGNMRKPGTHLAFGMGASGLGLSGLLKANGNIDDAVVRSNVPGIWLLPVGAALKEPTFRLEQKLPTILSQLRKKADCIIIDGPALLSNADALLLATMVDCVALVVDVRHDKMPVLVRTKELLTALAKTPAGLIMNRAPKRNRNRFYATAPVFNPAVVVEALAPIQVHNGNGHTISSNNEPKVDLMAATSVGRPSAPSPLPPSIVPPTPPGGRSTGYVGPMPIDSSTLPLQSAAPPVRPPSPPFGVQEPPTQRPTPPVSRQR